MAFSSPSTESSISNFNFKFYLLLTIQSSSLYPFKPIGETAMPWQYFTVCIFQSNANRSLHFPFLPGHLNWSSLEAKIKKSIQRPTVSLSILCHVIQHLIPTSLFLNFYIYSLWLIHKVRDQIRQVWMQVVIIDNRQIKNSRIANLTPSWPKCLLSPIQLGPIDFVFVAQPFSP
jgi:hypothetical protein